VIVPIVVSLLVHSELTTSVSLARNILAALRPEALAVHVSASARFTPEELRAELGSVDKVLVNQVRHQLEWGRIIPGHRANLALLLQSGVPEDASVVFHASNDWYVRAVDCDRSWPIAGYQPRPVQRDTSSVWAHRTAARRALDTWSYACGLPAVMSQCEGTWFPLGWAAGVLDEAQRVLGTGLHSLPAEEYVLPTAAASLPGEPGRPLVFSEVIRQEALVADWWNRMRYLIPPSLRLAPLKVVIRVCNLSPGRWALRPEDLQVVRTTGTAPMAPLVREGTSTWRPYDAGLVAAVKRIPLDPAAPLRCAANAMTL
jgi:hypothetical protein